MIQYAVIDLGTNTCNLLIAYLLCDGSFKTVYDRKLPVKLGRGGIHKDILLPDAIERGLNALKMHAETIKKFDITTVKVVGTSALRGAVNRDEFLEKVRQLFGWEIEILGGELEAELIFRGVQLSIPDGIGKYLILDIGGGSIEFILANDKAILWKRSFNIGIARALETIQISELITSEEIKNMEYWFDEHLNELWEFCEQNPVEILVGCSGAFDTFMDIHEKEIPDQKIREVSELPLDAFFEIHHRLIHADFATRSSMAGMDKMRVEMIVVASVFTNFILKRLHIQQLLHTHYSLKEGIMDKLITKGL
jgi:exopolyphosphatase/guanosine-5'-triphosphate,3'-diphosphate pyrophosphatase